jgi:teichuronic acid biosynthesis glycosyltransferase TuaH
VSRSATLAGDWSGLVVVFGETRWDGCSHLDQHYAVGLSVYAPVLYVEPPSVWRPGALRRTLRPPKAMRRGIQAPPVVDAYGNAELCVIGPRLARLTPHLPPASGAAGGALPSTLVRRSLRKALASMGSPAVTAAVSFVPDAPIAAVDAARRAVVVRETQAGSPAGRRRRRHVVGIDDLARLDRDAFDFVITSSPFVAEQLRTQLDDRPTLLLPYGIGAPALSTKAPAERAPDVHLPHPVAGYVGRLSDRLDLDLLMAVVDRDLSLLLVGPCARPEMVPGLMDLLQHPRVEWVGPRVRSAVGQYMREMDVGLVPYTDTDENQLAFPTQTLDYLAAGRPVVSTDLAATRWLLSSSRGAGGHPGTPSVIDDAADLVIAHGAEMFAATVSRLVVRGRTRDEMVRRHTFARTHSWDRRMQKLAEGLGVAGVAGDRHSGPGRTPSGRNGTTKKSKSKAVA